LIFILSPRDFDLSDIDFKSQQSLLQLSTKFKTLLFAKSKCCETASISSAITLNKLIDNEITLSMIKSNETVEKTRNGEAYYK